jgi:TolB-like protein/Tfp pilus assembly protein PilF
MSSLIAELRSRKIVQWTLAYLAGAFVVLQVLDILADTFALPALVMRTATVLLAFGAVAAIIIAWYHGEKGQQRISGIEIVMLAAILIVAGIAMVVVGPKRNGNATSAAAPAAEQASVAVLPFINMSSDKDQDYFGDGITEEILNVLAQLPGLRVPGRTSSFSFKNKDLPISEIARQLNVAHVLEGSVRKSGDKVRITAQLIDARKDEHLWSQSYDRDLSDVFAVQDEIARAIVQALRLRIKLPADTQLVQVATRSGQAHELYLRGLHYWRNRHEDELPRALEQFKAAIEKDPKYAPAYAGLALTYAVLPLTTSFDRPLAVREGKAAAERALQLDPDNAEAHAALGQIAEELESDWTAAEQHLDQAIALDPANATAHQWRAEVHIIKGEHADALKETERAVALDPLNNIVQLVRALALNEAGRSDEAIEIGRAIMARDSQFALIRGNLLDQLLTAGRYDEAIALASNENTRSIIRAIPDARRRPAALRLLASPDVRVKMTQGLRARYYLRLGQPDSALAILNRAARNWEPNIAYLGNARSLRPLWPDPRFAEFRRTLGLKADQPAK